MTKPAIPQSPGELAEILNDAAKFKEFFTDDDVRNEFIDGYQRKSDKNGEITTQVREQVQLGMAEFMAANGAKAGPPVPLADSTGKPVLNRGEFRNVSTGRGGVYNKAAVGARKGLDEVFDNSAEFFQAIWPRMDAVLRNRKDLRTKLDKYNDIQTDIRNSFGSEVPADGGFLIPETLRSEILQLALESSISR